MFFEGFQIAKATIFINESVLVIIAAILFGIFDGSSNQAGCRNVLHIDLNLLSRINRPADHPRSAGLFFRLCAGSRSY